MKSPLCSLAVLLVWASAVQPALAQSAEAGKAATRTAILEAVSAGDTQRAYNAYDRFVMTGGKQDASLLGLVAAEELRAIARHASDDPRLQIEAFERLARHGDAGAQGELQRMALGLPNTPVAALADGALVRLGDAPAMTRLVAMASSSTMKDKSNVAEAIRRSGVKELASAVVPLLTDPEWPTRTQAIEALAELDYTAAVPEIRSRLTDEDSQVRSKAVLALKRLGDNAADAKANAMMRSGVASARLEALQADRATDRADLVAAARQLAGDPDSFNRVKAAEALAGDDPAAALAVLRMVAGESDSTARRLAARGLESLRPTDVALLRRLLQDESGWVRMYAAGGVLGAAPGR